MLLLTWPNETRRKTVMKSVDGSVIPSM